MELKSHQYGIYGTITNISKANNEEFYEFMYDNKKHWLPYSVFKNIEGFDDTKLNENNNADQQKVSPSAQPDNNKYSAITETPILEKEYYFLIDNGIDKGTYFQNKLLQINDDEENKYGLVYQGQMVFVPTLYKKDESTNGGKRKLKRSYKNKKIMLSRKRRSQKKVT